MERQSPSIFNDILGPIMVGPSSSHTCAPSRIGYLCRQLVGGRLKKAIIEFAREGAYTEMYQGQRSDMGFINGLLGNRPEDPGMKHAFDLAQKAGVEIQFKISDFIPVKPNLSIITLYDDQGEIVTVNTDSTGGGTVKLMEIDGYGVEIVGDCYELLVFGNVVSSEAKALLEKCQALFKESEGCSMSQNGWGCLINIKCRSNYRGADLETIAGWPEVQKLRVITPILTVTSNRKGHLPFRDATGLLEVADREGKALWELAVDYEKARSGFSEEEIMAHTSEIIEIMEKGVQEALKGDIDMKGILMPTAGKINRFMKSDARALDMGLLNVMVPWAMATMEYSSAMGVVICGPTGGSAGVFPGAVLGAAVSLGLSEKEKIKLMLTTAIIGIAMSKECHYSAELYGCQVEPGAASAMAAGALVYLMGGTPKQSLQAASCAIQNILGTICDPVAGMVQLPCISRNSLSVANTLVSANMVMGGYDPMIPLDEAAETMFRVGTQLPKELRCTCRGGLCITPSGQRLAAEQKIRDQNR